MHVLKEFSETLTVNKSKFICYIFPCFNEEEYKSYLNQIRKKHYDADHVCSAMICDKAKKSSDDGEPSGTAGIPILSILEKRNMDNTCALVVRYFGGIKLGAGGLIRAYSDSVVNTLNICELYEYEMLQKYSLTVPYELSKDVDKYLSTSSYIFNKDYQEKVIFTFGIDNESKIDNILNITKGIKPEYIKDEKIDKIVK